MLLRSATAKVVSTVAFKIKLKICPAPNNGLFKENLVKYKGKRASQDIVFIVFHP